MLKSFFLYLFIFTSGTLGILYYFLNDKFNKQTTQVRLLTKQLNGLSSQVNSYKNNMRNITVYYGPISFTNGQVVRSCSLYISPLINSSILRTISSGTKVEILDSVEVQETLWYEVKAIIQDDKNLKGFIRQDFITPVTVVESNSVRRKYY